jgi:hypothetical protein
VIRRGRTTTVQATDPQADERGQSVVEFIVIVPIVAMLLLIMLEFGLAFNHRLTVGYASREGARIGAALAHGGATSCTVADPALVDQQVIAATQRILKSPGSPIVMSDVNSIRIYKADAAGRQIGSLFNLWTYTPGAGPDIDPGPTVDRLDFSQASVAWPACGRRNGTNPDSIGVQVVYVYRLSTPLRAAADFFGSGSNVASTFAMTDQTIMSLNPTN